MADKDQHISRVNKNKQDPNKKKKTKKKNRGKRIGWALFITAVVAIFCALGGYLFIMITGEKLLEQNIDKLTANGTSKVYDRNGNLMGELSIQKSDPVDIEDIPELLKAAFIATEDKRFNEHNGVDIWAIGRAAVKDIMARSMVEGGSTITQQLAKNLFLTRDKTFFRKATEVSIALALERKLTKDEILELYLNRINFGGQYYGIKAASERYFGKSDLDELELWEMATLAAMPKGPSKYNPIRNPELSKERRAVVLTLMEQQGYITAAEAAEAKEVDYAYKPPATQQKYTAFIDYVMDEAEEKWGLTADDLNIGGYQIYTTMDIGAQDAIEKEFDNPDNFENIYEDVTHQGSMVIINQETGGIVAMAGGRDYERGGFNRAVGSKRSPGSTLKPVAVYAPALETGEWFKDSPLSNAKQCFGNGTYCPNNLHGYSDTVSMSTAVQNSENIPAVWLLERIGVKTGYDFVKKLGIGLTDNDKNLSLALGGVSSGSNTLEMAQAFSAFASGGELNEAYAIKQIKNSSGKVIHENKATKERVMKADTAAQMTDMLQQVVEEGTGKNAQISRPVAGKTGTTQSGVEGVSGIRDAWFVGYTPELTAAVWMGYDDPGNKYFMKQSSPLAASLWGKVMEKAVQGYEAKTFPSTEPAVPEEPEEVKPELSAVRNLIGSYDAQTQTVNLNWTAAEGEGIEYRVYRKEASETDYSRVLDALTGTAADDISVMEGLTYSYYVTAYDPAQDLESEPSNTVEVVTAGAAPEEPEEEPVEEQEPEQPEENTNPAEPGEQPGEGEGGGEGGTEQPGTGGGESEDAGNGQGNGGQGNGQDSGTGGPGSGQGTNPGDGQGNGQGNDQGEGTGAPGTDTGTPESGTDTGGAAGAGEPGASVPDPSSDTPNEPGPAAPVDNDNN